MAEYFDNSPLDPPDYFLGEMVYMDGHPFRCLFEPSLDTHPHDRHPVAGFASKAESAANDPRYSSGVGKHFFHLPAEGQVAPAARFNKAVTADRAGLRRPDRSGEGRHRREAAGRIGYRANATSFAAQTTWPQGREWTRQAARDLVGLGRLDAGAVNAVACAWEAVNGALPLNSPQAACVQRSGPDPKQACPSPRSTGALCFGTAQELGSGGACSRPSAESERAVDRDCGKKDCINCVFGT